MIGECPQSADPDADEVFDAPHFDAQRTTWGAADTVNMIQDTLVALDWDALTPIPYLAKSWQISPDGRTYTFKLRDDVTFCSGKKLTADDVIYTFKRLQDPAINSPVAWRAGKIKALRAPDPYTVEYELEEPYSGLLLQLTMFNNVIINKESVEKLGQGLWRQRRRRHRALVLRVMAAAQRDRARRHDAYHWGPTMYRNPGPVQFDRLVIRSCRRISSRVAAMMSGTVRLSRTISRTVHRSGEGGTDAARAGGQAELPAPLFRLQDDSRHGGGPAGPRGDEHRHQSRRDRQGCDAGPRRAVLHLSSTRRRSTTIRRPPA